MTKSVLYVSQPTITGVGQCVYDWSTRLAGRGWDVTVACPEEGWLRTRCAEAGLRTFSWTAVRQPYIGVADEVSQLRTILAEVRPDVVHLHGSKAGLSGRLAIRGRIPTAFSPHSWSFEASGGPIGAGALVWERLAARWTSAVVCVSEAEMQDGLAHRIRAPYVIARNGVDTTAIAPLGDEQRRQLRESLGIGDQTMAVVCVGRIHRQKGQDVLLRAWPAAAGPDRRLYLVGDGPMMGELAAANTRTDVVFVGGVERRAALDWMQAADVVVLPSRWEGMALVPLESLALGTPVVVSDVTGAREAVDETCGSLVAAEDPAALAAGLEAWMGRDPQDLLRARRASRDRVVGRFELNQTVDVIEHTLTGLMG